MSDQLRRLFERAKHRAIRAFVRERSLTTGFVMTQNLRGAGDTMPLAWHNNLEKAMLLMGMRVLFRRKGIVRFAIAHEVWTSVLDMPPGTTKEQAFEIAQASTRPSQRIDRKDGVMMLAIEKEPRAQLAGMFPIIREIWHTKLGPFHEVEAPDEIVPHTFGRLFDA